jgi:hypothetical protein
MTTGDVDESGDPDITTVADAYATGSAATYYGELQEQGLVDSVTLVANQSYLIYTIPEPGANAEAANAAAGDANTANANINGLTVYRDPNTGGNAPGYLGDYVTQAANGGPTSFGGGNYAEDPIVATNSVSGIGNYRDINTGVRYDASGVPVSAQEVYIIPVGTPTDIIPGSANADGTSTYVDPNTGGNAPGSLGSSVVASSESGEAGALSAGYSSNSGYEGEGYNVDGDNLAGMGASVAYVIPPETYVDGSVVGFTDPNTGKGSSGDPESAQYVRGAVGGGNNTVGRDEGLAASPNAWTESGDYRDSGYSESYAIPYEAYADANASALGQSVGGAGNAPGYQGGEVTQGANIGGLVAEGKGYSEVYEIPYVAADDVVTRGDVASTKTGYKDPNTGGAAPGYLGDFVTGASNGVEGSFSMGNEGVGALEEYVIGEAWDGTGGGYVDPQNGLDQSVVTGSSRGAADFVGNVGYEEYVIPAAFKQGDGRGNYYIDPNTGGAAPGYLGDYVSAGPGGGLAPSGESTEGKGYSETYAIPSDTYIDPNTGGNKPGYQGDYVTANQNTDQTTLVNLTEEFLGDNTDAGKTTITEPSTTTKATIVTSVATRCTANC